MKAVTISETKNNLSALLDRVRAGETVLEEGKPGGCVYVLIRGRATCLVDGYEVGRVDAPGTILGEISALLRSNCTATVVTATDCVRVTALDSDTVLRELTLLPSDTAPAPLCATAPPAWMAAAIL